jgi:hypothetical protein
MFEALERAIQQREGLCVLLRKLKIRTKFVDGLYSYVIYRGFPRPDYTKCLTDVLKEN